jgi:hypothetical protein
LGEKIALLEGSFHFDVRPKRFSHRPRGSEIFEQWLTGKSIQAIKNDMLL